jgi:hypothetical protein
MDAVNAKFCTDISTLGWQGGCVALRYESVSTVLSMPEVIQTTDVSEGIEGAL